MKNFTLFLIILFFSSFASFAEIPLPSKVYFDVPFLCQAPYGNWKQPWQDACEEAVIIMAIKYVQKKPLTRKSGNSEILDMVKFQRKKYGGHYDLNAKEIARLIKDYYGYKKIKVRYDIKVEDIKDELAKGNVVIAPMAGRLLRNRYYSRPGPVYHALVFKGYNDRWKEFITNDPGTKRGRNYRYRYKVAYNAIHDWTGSKKTILKGRKAIIIVSK